MAGAVVSAAHSRSPHLGGDAGKTVETAGDTSPSMSAPPPSGSGREKRGAERNYLEGVGGRGTLEAG